MDLRSIIKNLQTIRRGDSAAGLFNNAKAELYFRQSYQGRFLFELIQNVRDANKIAGVKGRICITLDDDRLTIANSGTPFSEKGINSITMIGDSTKESLDFIGHKGIGFKSIYEISNNPQVVTEWGTIEFSKEKTRAILREQISNLDNVPLFFVPHYNHGKLSSEELQSGIVTKIILPFKSGVNKKSVEEAFNEISVRQILLLGYLDEINFSSSTFESFIKIVEQSRTGQVRVIKNNENYYFKHFITEQGYHIPLEIIASLEEGEKEIYEKDPTIQISLVFETDPNGKLIGSSKSKLYLFYPTEISSGFNFIIHSYFVVNPERKALRSSSLNDFILERIADYLANEWLQQAKKSHKKFYLDLLVFERNAEVKALKLLYDRLVSNLKEIKFIYDPVSDKFYKSTEVVITSEVELILFPDCQIGKKRLVKIAEAKTRDWLVKEFGTEELNGSSIADNIERQCKAQKNKKNFEYFDGLYAYLVKNSELDLSNKKILLTTKMTLLSSQDDVFYGLNEKIDFRETVQKKIHFIHSKIKIRKARQGQNQTGFIEYSADQLLRRIVALYRPHVIPYEDILDALLKVNVPEKNDIDFRKNVLFPVGTEGHWASSLYNPVYFPTAELLEIYPKEKFIRMEEFADLEIDEDALKTKLLRLGVWDEPAIYFDRSKRRIYETDKQSFSLLKNHTTYKTTPYFNVIGDWILDRPLQINVWFTRRVIINWPSYVALVEGEYSPEIKYSSAQSYEHRLGKHLHFELSSIYRFLRTEPWICEKHDDAVPVNEILLFDPIELKQPHALTLKKYIRTFPISLEMNRNIIAKLDLLHLDDTNLDTFRRVLTLVYKTYQHVTENSRDLISFYNRILNKLYDCYAERSFDKGKIMSLSEIYMLSIDEMDNRIEWRPAKDIFYIEDMPSYEILPDKIKRLIQPQFSNRNKNRFGQIAKKLGKDFRKTISQKIIGETVLYEKDFYAWFPYLPEVLALCEVVMGDNLDHVFSQIKETQVKVCDQFSLELYQGEELVDTLKDVAYKITDEGDDVIFVKDAWPKGNSKLNANLLHDLLVNVLDRDLTRLRFSLTDFFEARDKYNYLILHDVPTDRIDDIRQILGSKPLDNRQYFWSCTAELIHGLDGQLVVTEETVGLEIISSAMSVSIESLQYIDQNLDYDELSNHKNQSPLQNLLQLLGCSLRDMRQTGLDIDFSKYYNTQVNGLKMKFKPQFEQRLHQYLSSQDMPGQSRFQHQMDEYEEWSMPKISADLLTLDTTSYFDEQVSNQYPFLFAPNLIPQNAKTPAELYNINLLKLQTELGEQGKVHLSAFLDIPTNRSRLYFPDNHEALVKDFSQFIAALNAQPEEHHQGGSFQGFTFKTGLEVTKVKTGALKDVAKEIERKSGGGHRGDGAKANPNKSLIGLYAESQVYYTLKEKFESVEWVSKNAAHAKVNPEGSDFHGYDIRYVDNENITRYVEVKGKSDDKRNFFISHPEYRKALNEGEAYSIYLVNHALETEKRTIEDIGNIFLLDKKYDLMNNPNFTANFSVIEINYLNNET